MTIINLDLPMKFRLKSDAYIDLSIMFLLLGKLWLQMVQRQLLTLVQQV
jgi:hypothetical protein